MTFKDATKTKACCNCVHCIRHKTDRGVVCRCDIDNHYQGYLEVMGLRCELWEGGEMARKKMSKLLTNCKQSVKNSHQLVTDCHGLTQEETEGASK